MAELNLKAEVARLDDAIAFVDERLEANHCPMKAKIQIDIAVEEIFINIANYAYNPEIGVATICVDVQENPLQITITFMDNGKPYDPLQKKDPDTSLSLEEREIGGLGIFMVKKIMDDIRYQYKDGKNILTLKKNI